MNIQLLAMDIDGTLIADRRTIPPRTRAAVGAVVAQGVHVTLATGRAYEVTRPFVEVLELTTPTICYQGGMIFNGHTGQTLHQESFALPLAHRLIDLARARRLALHLHFGGNGFYTEAATLLSRRAFGEVKATVIEVADLKQVTLTPPIKGMVVHPPDEAAAVVTELQAELNGSLSVYRSHAELVEITSPITSKGRALAWLAEYYDIPPENVMAIGDHDNDIDMLAWAGLGVAMGNATAGAKAAANVIAPPVTEEGVVWAIEQFILPGSKVAE
jgi:hypothetical protein